MNVKVKRLLILATGTILLLFLGMIYAWSIFVKPLEAEFGWLRSSTSLVFVISIISFTIGNLISGQILKKRPVQVVFVIGAILLLIGFIGASRTKTLLNLYLFYGVICSSGIGLIYNGIVPNIIVWFPDKSGVASGTCLMGYGLGAFILGPIISSLLSSDFGWRNVFLILGIAFFIIVLISSFIIRSPKDHELGELPANKVNGQEVINRDVTTSEMLKSSTFYLFFIWMFLLGSVGLAVIGIGATLPTEMSNGNAMLAAFVAGVASIGNGSGRLIGGCLCDKLGRKKTMLIANTSFVLGAVILIASQLVNSIPVLGVGYLICGMSFGCILLIMTYFCKTIYGQKYMGMNFALINCYGILAVFVGNFGAGKIYDIKSSYLPVFYIMIIFILLAFVVMSLLNKAVKVYEK